MRSFGVVVMLLACVAVPGDVGAARLLRVKAPARSQHTLPPRARTLRVRRKGLARPPRRSPQAVDHLRPEHAAASKILIARETIGHVVEELTPNRRMSDLSISALTLAGAPGVSGPSNISLPLHLDVFTGVSALALSAASIVDYRRALDGPGKMDAAHGLAWGLQSLTALAGNAASNPLLKDTSEWLGVGGGAIQTALGLYRLKDGLARRDRRVTILGALDLVSGVSWIASTTSFNPVALGVFLASTGARVVYANAGLIKHAWFRQLESTRASASAAAARARRLGGRRSHGHR